MEWWQILLYIVAMLLLVYFIFFFYSFDALLSFRSKEKKRALAFQVLLQEKKEMLLSLYSLIIEKGVARNESMDAAASRVRWLSIEKMKGKEIEEVNGTLSALEKRILLSDALNGIEEAKSLTDALDDINMNYRRLAALYNEEVDGYEYWRKALLFQWIFFVFGFRKIDRLH